MKRILCLLLALLTLAACPAALAELKRGDDSIEVADLQSMLFDMGFLFEEPDGMFGANTEQAVKDFQICMEMEPTGIADDVTIENVRQEWASFMERMSYQYVLDDDYPAFCNHWNHENGSSQLDYCANHMALRIQADALLATGSEADAEQACALWREEINRLYDEWAASSANPASIEAARSLFLSEDAVRETAVRELYDSYEVGDYSVTVYAALETPLREHAAWLCALLNGVYAD